MDDKAKEALKKMLAGALTSGEATVMEMTMGPDGKVSLGGPPQRTGWPVTINPAAQIMTLREQLDDYVNPQFKVGDIVTPKPFTTTKGVGQPWMVIDTRYDAKTEAFDGERAGSAMDGRVLNLRLMCYVDNETITAFWDEAWIFEAWDDRKHGK
jgi:hypothetical protein